MMRPPKHVLLELDDDGDLHSVDGDSDAPAEAPTRRAGLRARPKQRDLSWGPGDGSEPKKPRTAAQLQVAALRRRPGPGKGEKTVILMRRIGDASWRRFGTQKDAAKAFGLYQSEVSYLINDRSKASSPARRFEARRVAATASVCDGPSRRDKCVEGSAQQKKNGKWIDSHMFPGREFDDLDEYRAAKKQRKELRTSYYAVNKHNTH
ncbi:unnamed protein product [Pelagomonas calceolata]|uniref:Uncharacterized protein n=1 Tax=Pelagomonas calceolata TaxID=35677 RepID=A0A8J2SVW2_9STRA|nr:unnamed protein product [Pelagomonas calceolata]